MEGQMRLNSGNSKFELQMREAHNPLVVLSSAPKATIKRQNLV